MKYLRVMDGTKSNAGGFEYKLDEVNIATLWNPKADSPETMGGFNFSVEDKILRWLHRGNTIYDVIIPEDAEVIDCESKNTPHGVFRSNKIIVTNPRIITEDMVMDLYKKSNLPEHSYYQCLVTLLYKNHKETVKYIIQDRINENNVEECIKEFERMITDKHDGQVHEFDYDALWDDAKEIYDILKQIKMGGKMNTTIYLVRHSEPSKEIHFINNTDSLQIQNEKKTLSVDGEKLTLEVSKHKEFQNIDYIVSSNYVRAISTAKYFAHNNHLKLNIDEDFGERKIGINSWDDYPIDFEKHQFEDESYKIGKGESQLETRNRMYHALMNILKEYQGKRIVIVSHSTAIAFLLGTWCEISYDSSYKFNGKVFFEGKWNYCETFKLEFENNNLKSIENIKL